ncbi:MAG: putative baseplate assembly protein [Gammaproteobacteria bacterium]|nr:putative baseplate assembly protein [Gammaproteobacteria bacterium]
MLTDSIYCQNKLRRHKVREHELNGLDYIEVSEDQLNLTVYFLDKAPEKLVKENIQISGGQHIRNIRVIELRFCRQDDPEIDDCMIVTVDKPGDFSTYTLCLVDLDEEGKPTQERHHAFDPRYACVGFNFKEDCPSDLDCKQDPLCPSEVRVEPEINYLAKDYASFRQLMLDRLALIMPDWQERHVPDIGVALVEIFAYVGDHLSYYQDAVATEAYLNTARQRISVRRHARLVDYRMHEGCNARAWLHINTSMDYSLEVAETYFITRHSDIPFDGRILTTNKLSQIAESEYQVFESLVDLDEEEQALINLVKAHNDILFYTWGDTECCLRVGTLSATLIDDFDNGPVITISDDDDDNDDDGENTPSEPQRKLKLKVGDFLLFEEVMGPKTGNPADANPAHRHVVRLSRVSYEQDPLYEQPIVEISWLEEDALPFPLCLSSQASDCTLLDKVSVARANIILVDHGRREEDESLGLVAVKETDTRCADKCDPAENVVIAAKFKPTLQEIPLTFSQPLPGLGAASHLLQQDPRQALPKVQLAGKRNTTNGKIEELWLAQLDLLESYPDDNHFVVEMEDDRQAQLRFGDGESGRKPVANTDFYAVYRTGNGSRGNVGAETIAHVVQRSTMLNGIQLLARNPLPAAGGADPEPTSEVKMFAPHAFRETLQRAITAEDYAEFVKRDFATEVQRAAASLRWTGSWYEVLVAVDPLGTEKTESELNELLTRISDHLHRYRRMGHDLRVALAQYVALDIEIRICVDPDYLRGHVKVALLKVFSNRMQTDRWLGFFHPDKLTFGEGIYLSQIVAAAQAVTGVASVTVNKLQRLYEENNEEAIESGVLLLGPLEVARLDNDPNIPENGKLFLDMRGGR